MTSVKENIKHIFDNMTYFEEYNSDVWFTIIAFFITIVILIYFYINNFIKSHRNSWEENKCNPIYMPFADFFITDSKEQNIVGENFNKCLNYFNSGIANDSKKPLDAVFAIIKSMFAFFSSIISQIVFFFSYLLNLITQIFLILIQRIKLLLHSINIFLIRSRSFLQNIIDTITDVYYLLLVAIELGMKLMIVSVRGVANTTLLTGILTYITVLIAMIISIIVAYLIGWFFPPAWAQAILNITLFIIATVYLIFTIFIFISFTSFTNKISEKI